MIFNSPEFLVFFAVVYGLYLCLPRPSLQNLLLLAASYVFYGWAAPKYLWLLIFYTALTYAAGIGMDRSAGARSRKAFLLFGLAVNLGVLGYFKYFGFFAGEATRALAALGFTVHPVTLQIFLPIGVSFFTFQSIAYLVDVYRGKARAVRDIVAFAVFKAFFPQLVAGPIERAQHMMPQIERPRRITAEDLLQGLFWILLGFFLKSVIADRVASYADYHFTVLDGPYRGPLATFTAAWAFGLQIYGDFAGYSTIALGTARLMGFRLERNFLGPYLASNIQEFWRCWHVTLSSWLRDYLYVPLGGSRRGTVRTYANLIATMGLGGLWHGASWNFVLWGLYHGCGLAIHRAAAPRLAGLPEALRRVGGWAATLVFVTFGWVLFRVASLAEFSDFMRRMLTPGPITARDLQAAFVVAAFFAIVLLVQWAEERQAEGARLVHRLQWPSRLGLMTALAVSVFAVGFSDHRFIYFQF